MNVQPSCLPTYLQYNPTDGICSDLFESANQLGQDDTTIWRLLYGLISPGGLSPNLDIIGLVKDYLSRSLSVQVESDLASLAHTIRQSGGLVLIGHSQGNLYVNDVYDLLLSIKDKKRTAVVAIATPSDHVPGDVHWTTLQNDFIWHVPGALGSNTNNGYCGDQLACHSLISSYLTPAPAGVTSPSEPHIKSDLSEAIRSVTTNLQWLSFEEGDPGLPRDGLSVTASNDGVFHLLTPISLLSLPNGLTTTVFGSFASGDAGVGLRITAANGGSCQFTFSFGENGVRTAYNAVPDITINTRQYDYSTLVENANNHAPGCGFTLSNLSITGLILTTPSFEIIRSFDAATILPGEDDLPGSTVE